MLYGEQGPGAVGLRVRRAGLMEEQGVGLEDQGAPCQSLGEYSRRQDATMSQSSDQATWREAELCCWHLRAQLISHSFYSSSVQYVPWPHPRGLRVKKHQSHHLSFLLYFLNMIV